MLKRTLMNGPAIDSPVAALVANYPIRSRNVIAHIRKATHGEVALVNTHPFMRELWGCYWIFDHNGTLKNYAPRFGSRFRPVGATDNETWTRFAEGRLLAFQDGAPVAG